MQIIGIPDFGKTHFYNAFENRVLCGVNTSIAWVTSDISEKQHKRLMSLESHGVIYPYICAKCLRSYHRAHLIQPAPDKGGRRL